MNMDDLEKEKTEGLDFQYLGDVIDKKRKLVINTSLPAPIISIFSLLIINHLFLR